MRVNSIEVRRLELELLASVSTASGTHRRRPVTIVTVRSDVGVGVGECAALEAPSYTAEYADGAERLLVDVLGPLLVAGGEFADATAAYGALGSVVGNPMAKAALEMALLDAELRMSGRSFADFLGATRRDVPAGATIGIAPVGVSLAAAARAVAAGFTRLKCKIAPGRGVDSVRAIRAEFPELVLTVDANGSYALDVDDDVAELAALDALGLAAIEQPLAAGELTALTTLTARLSTPVLLDESVVTPGELDAALALRSGDAISLKPARLGGVLRSRAVHDRCRAEEIGLAIGGMFETGLGRAVALAVSALPGVDLPGDLGPSDRYFAVDLTAPHVMVGGRLAVPASPGSGVEIDPALLERLTVRVSTVGTH